DAFRAEVQSSAYQSVKYYETDPTLDALWANLNTSGAVARFAAMWSKERKLAEALMVNFLRQKPSRSAELVRLLDESTKRDNGIDENTRLTLWRLNAKAGHKEAQMAQMDAASSSSFSRKARMNALAHLDFENPEPLVVERALQLRRSTLNTTDRSERELGSMALLSLGGLGDASHANQAMNDSIAQKLVGYLGITKTPADTVTALQAIGNTGNSAALDAIKPYLNSQDESIRVNALEALRRMDSPQATGIAIASFEQNTDMVTRTAALRSLSSMPATPETMNWGRNVLSSAMADETRSQLAAWLGSQARTYPENAALLRELLRNTTSFEVKKSILKYIPPS
ncbi:MAG TPA: HEAT repeat domain-containing protein, partial [Polyangiaceae bacterium]